MNGFMDLLNTGLWISYGFLEWLASTTCSWSLTGPESALEATVGTFGSFPTVLLQLRQLDPNMSGMGSVQEVVK